VNPEPEIILIRSSAANCSSIRSQNSKKDSSCKQSSSRTTARSYFRNADSSPRRCVSRSPDWWEIAPDTESTDKRRRGRSPLWARTRPLFLLVTRPVGNNRQLRPPALRARSNVRAVVSGRLKMKNTTGDTVISPREHRAVTGTGPEQFKTADAAQPVPAVLARSESRYQIWACSFVAPGQPPDLRC
jgi:hypothetical protein